MKSDIEPLLLSIVIPAFTVRRIDNILRLLDSIEAQTYPHIEVIFVAERSPELFDKVKSYVAGKKFASQDKVIFNDTEPGVNASRNLGIKNASGSIIALVDDDVILSSCWAEEVVKTFAGDESCIAVGGAADPLWEDKRTSWFPREFYWLIGCTVWPEGWKSLRKMRNIGTMNCAFKREAFEKAGFFNASLGNWGGDEGSGWHQGASEDLEFSFRVRERTRKYILYNPRMSVLHKVPRYKVSLKFVAKRAYRMGYSRHMLNKLYPRLEGARSTLYVEQEHFKQILFRLIPGILKTFVKSPRSAGKKLAVTTVATLFAGLGYLVYPLKPYPPRKN